MTEVNFPNEEDQLRDKTIKNTKNTDLSKFNKQEIKGWIVERLNEIDLKINRIIIDYFKPQNLLEFEKILLNSSVINFGSKLKVLRNMKGFDHKIIDDLSKLSSIRNGFAHVVDSPVVQLAVGKEAVRLIEAFDQISVMNSSGIVKVKKFKSYLSEFHNLYTKTNNYLLGFDKDNRNQGVTS